MTTPSIPSDGDEARSSLRMIKGALLAAVAVLWVLPLRGSLWIDEMGTYWVIKDGLRETLDRAWDVQGQTPLYYVVEWLARVTIGESELALRLPSFAAMCVAAYLFYRLARRLMGEETALGAVFIFAITPSVGFFAGDARPYAMATLTVVVSTLFLVRWVDTGRASEGAAYVLFAALTVYIHYVFSLVLLSHAVYAVARRDRVRPRALVFAFAGTGVLLVPAIPQLLNLLRRSRSLSVPAGSAKEMLLETIAPPALIAGALVGLLLSHLIRPIRTRRVPDQKATLVLGAAWLLVAPSILFVISRVTPVTIFADRYLVTAVPGFAILGAIALSSVVMRRTRVIVLVAALAGASFAGASTRHTSEDWRGAIERIDALSGGPRTPVLVHGALIESKQISWLTDPQTASYLNGPTTYYRVDGQPVAMPYAFDGAAQGYLEGLLPTLRASGHFFYVTRYASVPTPQWILGRLSADGFHSRSIGGFGRVKVFEFTRG